MPRTDRMLGIVTTLSILLLPLGTWAGEQETAEKTILYTPHPLDKLAELKVGHLALAIIDAHGTWENWEKIENVDFTWEWRLYPSPDRANDPVLERVRMTLKGPLRCRIDRPEEHLTLVYDAGETWGAADGKLQEKKDLPENLPTLAWTTSFLFALPFNLPNRGYELHYTTQTSDDLILEVAIPPEEREGDIAKFTLFADLATFKLQRVLYELQGQFQVVQLSDYQTVDGIEIPYSRITSQSFSNGEPRRILMETILRDVRFNVFLDDGLFTRPPAPPQDRWKPRTGG